MKALPECTRYKLSFPYFNARIKGKKKWSQRDDNMQNDCRTDICARLRFACCIPPFTEAFMRRTTTKPPGGKRSPCFHILFYLVSLTTYAQVQRTCKKKKSPPEYIHKRGEDGWTCDLVILVGERSSPLKEQEYSTSAARTLHPHPPPSSPLPRPLSFYKR
jgi:hypothetical protein